MTTEEKIKVMQAYVGGRKIEWTGRGNDCWEDTSKPTWNWYKYNYRIKKSTREDMLEELNKVLVGGRTETWVVNQVENLVIRWEEEK